MSSTITTDIFCDYCNTWISGVSSNKPEVRLARKGAKRFGWRVKMCHEAACLIDLCPECAAALPREQTNDS